MCFVLIVFRIHFRNRIKLYNTQFVTTKLKLKLTEITKLLKQNHR